jgi:hypothetical protein
MLSAAARFLSDGKSLPLGFGALKHGSPQDECSLLLLLGNLVKRRAGYKISELSLIGTR